MLDSYLQVAWKLHIVVTKTAITIVYGNLYSELIYLLLKGQMERKKYDYVLFNSDHFRKHLALSSSQNFLK